MRIALITGASSGMGRVFAVQMDRTEKNIDEFWLVARRKDRLEELAERLEHPARVLAMDLTKPECVDELEALLDESVQVGVFVNCAGFGKIGNYANISRSDAEQMIDLNCKAAVTTTMLVLPRMKKGDRVMELCSTSSFQPVPYLNVYAAGKAFLYSYTRSLRAEVKDRGIIVTAICPWWVSDTEFIDVAKNNAANGNVGASIKSFPFASKKEAVVRQALLDSRKGKAVSTPGVMCSGHRAIAKVVPRSVMLSVWEIMRKL